MSTAASDNRLIQLQPGQLKRNALSPLRLIVVALAGTGPAADVALNMGPMGSKGYPSERTVPGQEADLQGRSAGGRSRVGGCPRLPGGTGGTFFDFELATSCR